MISKRQSRRLFLNVLTGLAESLARDDVGVSSPEPVDVIGRVTVHFIKGPFNYEVSQRCAQ
jgi:hypothetical protein